MKNKYKNKIPFEILDEVERKIEKLPSILGKSIIKTLKKKADGRNIVITSIKKLPTKTLVHFDDNQARIVIGKEYIQLPPYKNEHFLCRVIFLKGVGNIVDWSDAYEQMTGYYKEYWDKPLETRQHWRTVYDTVNAVNRRFKQKFSENLLYWQEKTIKRLR